ncbi:MAG TPA: methyltransferase, partial [Methanoregula sp.]|nr:methyltransferase [Methanoregula sp.]
MIEAALVSILPAGFLIILFGGGALFLRRKIEQDGTPPINRTVFYASKYSILVLWGAMVAQSWGISLSFAEVPRILQIVALGLWGFGFLLMYLGRFRLGDSFRLGNANESTELRTGGLFRLSRNPMYVGVYATIAASSLYTLNPVVILLGAFVIAVHHRIVLAEERYLHNVFGRPYAMYCGHV